MYNEFERVFIYKSWSKRSGAGPKIRVLESWEPMQLDYETGTPHLLWPSIPEI
jgi:hypothetical protein